VADAMSPEEVLVHQLRAWRRRRGLTAQELADRVARSGGNLSRQAISKIETGDRKVTPDELYSLAYVLDVPPLLLTLPLGVQPDVQILGHAVPTWQAFKWSMGEVGIDGGDGAGAAVIGYFRDHDELINTVLVNRERGEQDLAASFAERLLDLRKNMRRAGVLPPELPADLADIDQEEGGERGRPDQTG
jgi:transcriptional regulator with XRE-family HTH domain